MKAILVKEDLATAIDDEDKLLDTMKPNEKKELMNKVFNSLILGLGDEC